LICDPPKQEAFRHWLHCADEIDHEGVRIVWAPARPFMSMSIWRQHHPDLQDREYLPAGWALPGGTRTTDREHALSVAHTLAEILQRNMY
jgi:hypothetical protein